MEMTTTTQQTETSTQSTQLNWNNVIELMMIQGLAVVIALGIFSIQTLMSL